MRPGHPPTTSKFNGIINKEFAAKLAGSFVRAKG
jgi:hypothetical protein